MPGPSMGSVDDKGKETVLLLYFIHSGESHDGTLYSSDLMKKDSAGLNYLLWKGNVLEVHK